MFGILIQINPTNIIVHSQWFIVMFGDPLESITLLANRWFISFVDDHTRMTWIFLMKKISVAGQIFKNFNKMIQTQFQAKIQVLKTDNAREYFKSILEDFLLSEGIVHQSSCVDTPQQNGIAKRKNIHLLEVAISLVFSTHVPG